MKFETAYNRHIRNARNCAKGYSGLERAQLIAEYFSRETDHPHVNYTYKSMLMDRSSDHLFAIDLMQSLADLCAKRELF